MRTIERAACTIVFACALQACQSLDSFVSARATDRASPWGAAIDGIGREPSELTREVLALNGVRWRSGACTTIVDTIEHAPVPEAQRQFALAELRLLAANAKPCSNDRTQLLIDAARAAYTLLRESRDDHQPPMPLSVAIYNRAVANLITNDLVMTDLRRAAATGAVQSTYFELSPDSRAILSEYDELIDSERMSITGFIERHRRSGVGAALIATRTGDHTLGAGANYFRRGAAIPITAILRFDRSPARLELIPSVAETTIRIYDRDWPLHADFTAPYAWTQHGSKWRRAGLASAFLPTRLARYRGIYLVEPLETDKVPILMIHGLAAGPQAWRNITNEILGTVDLHRHYQIWHYFYPSGQPYLQSAAELRADLASLRTSLASQPGAPALPPLIVMGHSQGGLIARALVTDPGDQLWNTVFKVRPEELSIDEARRQALSAALRYQPTPAIDRMIFMETPHHGSNAPQRSFLLRLLDRFVDVPDELSRTIRRLARAGSDELTPFGRSIAASGGPSPMHSLDATSPLAQTFGRLPLAGDTRYHSIIAAQDEFLSYESAHIAEAESEIVIAARHQETDGATSIAEIVRILRLGR
jgi:pimeloyl-ACP methyl ester carboxylesterase